MHRAQCADAHGIKGRCCGRGRRCHHSEKSNKERSTWWRYHFYRALLSRQRRVKILNGGWKGRERGFRAPYFFFFFASSHFFGVSRALTAPVFACFSQVNA